MARDCQRRAAGKKGAPLAGWQRRVCIGAGHVRTPQVHAPRLCAAGTTQKNAELLEGYDVRVGAAVDFLQRVRPGIQVSPGPLTDPAEPPLVRCPPFPLLRPSFPLLLCGDASRGPKFLLTGHHETPRTCHSKGGVTLRVIL